MCVDGAVKLSIKSFTVPELFVDLPETASVASLKVGNIVRWHVRLSGMTRVEIGMR